MATTDRLRWGELLGLGLGPLALLPQLFFLGYVCLFPHGGLGGIGDVNRGFAATTPDARIAWVFWIVYTFPPTFAQALVLTPLACLHVLARSPQRVRLVAAFSALSAVTLLLCGLVLWWM